MGVIRAIWCQSVSMLRAQHFIQIDRAELASVLVISFTCRTAAPLPEPEAVTDFPLVISRPEVVIRKRRTGKYVLCVEINKWNGGTKHFLSNEG